MNIQILEKKLFYVDVYFFYLVERRNYFTWMYNFFIWQTMIFGQILVVSGEGASCFFSRYQTIAIAALCSCRSLSSLMPLSLCSWRCQGNYSYIVQIKYICNAYIYLCTSSITLNALPAGTKLKFLQELIVIGIIYHLMDH